MGELEHMVCESPCCDSLFSVKLHVSTINGSDGVDEAPHCDILLLVKLQVLYYERQ